MDVLPLMREYDEIALAANELWNERMVLINEAIADFQEYVCAMARGESARAIALAARVRRTDATALCKQAAWRLAWERLEVLRDLIDKEILGG